MWYPSCRLILTWPSSMTMLPAILPVRWVFCHGQQRARISIPLSTSGSCWWGLGPFTPEMSGNLQVPCKSGVTSYSKNLQIWCSPRGGDALQYLMQLVATPDTDCYFWPLPFVQGHINPFMLVTCLWNMFSLCLSWWILCLYKYLHMVSLLKINAVDSERTVLFLLSLYAGCDFWCVFLGWGLICQSSPWWFVYQLRGLWVLCDL
jgi:hypothetical protein